MREPITPTAYMPFRSGGKEAVSSATILVRTASQKPLSLAGILRREVPRARAEFRVSNLRNQAEINQSQTIRERLLAMLAVFFAGVALLLAGMGLYGVLDYSVVQQRREIGIRMAVGASASHLARRVLADVFPMLLVGAAAGTALGWAAARYIGALLYHARLADPAVLVVCSAALLVTAAAAAVWPVRRALRIDPIAVLRGD